MKTSLHLLMFLLTVLFFNVGYDNMPRTLLVAGPQHNLNQLQLYITILLTVLTMFWFMCVGFLFTTLLAEWLSGNFNWGDIIFFVLLALEITLHFTNIGLSLWLLMWLLG